LTTRSSHIPIRWTAPEIFSTGRYNIKCDVWSYGVVLWEIFKFGELPYNGWENATVRER
ncbi:hypothetical protein Ciccas_014405, partial [Cichlidogyrus casuarinus]